MYSSGRIDLVKTAIKAADAHFIECPKGLTKMLAMSVIAST